MKFCRPIFRSVYLVKPDLAQDVFSKSKEAFHPIARRLIEKASYAVFAASTHLIRDLCRTSGLHEPPGNCRCTSVEYVLVHWGQCEAFYNEQNDGLCILIR
jgi:hypothetical protein